MQRFGLVPPSKKPRTDIEPTMRKENTTNKKTFVSITRRYENFRIRDSQMTGRLCCECGMYIEGERKYQEHIANHEGVYLVYQLHYSELAQGNEPANKQEAAKGERKQQQQLDQNQNAIKGRKRKRHEMEDGAAGESANPTKPHIQD